MFTRDGVDYEFHHLGIPTDEKRADERFSARFGMYTSDDASRTPRIQWHRFTNESCLHPLIQSVPHLAFKVSDLDRALLGQKLLLGPYEPIEGFRVAIIDDGGKPIEFIETKLSDEEIWDLAKAGRKTSIY
jgi:hypothetical protein